MTTFTTHERRRKQLARLSSRFRAVLGAFTRIPDRSGGVARTCYYAKEMAETLAAYLDPEAKSEQEAEQPEIQFLQAVEATEEV